MTSVSNKNSRWHSKLFVTCSLALILTEIGLAKTSSQLITKEIVADIKSKTKSWKPYEPERNPFRNKTD